MESDGVWSLDRDGDGREKTWCCLAATARDLARIGRLYLREGDWDGHRIVPANWVHASTRRDGVPTADWPADYAGIGLENYGYQ